MYGVIYLIHFPDNQDPEMQSLELYPTYEKAEQRTREIVSEFNEEYGEDFTQHATEKKPVAVMYNGEVTGYAFIQMVSNLAETKARS